MSDDELIEKAAKAMADAGDVGWKGHTPDERDWYLRDARVALAVFREHTAPTDDEPIAYAIYGRATGNLRCVEQLDAEEVTERAEFYDVVPLFRRGAPADPVREYVKARTGATDAEIDELGGLGAPAEPAVTKLFPGEQKPIATNPILRGVDLALDRLVRQDCFTERTLRILDDLRAEVIGSRTPDELRAHYQALSTERDER